MEVILVVLRLGNYAVYGRSEGPPEAAERLPPWWGW